MKLNAELEELSVSTEKEGACTINDAMDLFYHLLNGMGYMPNTIKKGIEYMNDSYGQDVDNEYIGAPGGSEDAVDLSKVGVDFGLGHA